MGRGAVGCWEGRAEATAELQNGDGPRQGGPEGCTRSPWGHPMPYPPSPHSCSPQSPLTTPPGVRTSIVSTGEAATGQLPLPIPHQPHLQGCRTGGCPTRRHRVAGGVPPPWAGRCPTPTARLGPGSGRATGAVSISRRSLLEKEQKPREAINSRLLHTSASSAPASHGRGGGGPAAHPALGPAITPLPPQLWFSGQRPHPKNQRE